MSEHENVAAFLKEYPEAIIHGVDEHGVVHYTRYVGGPGFRLPIEGWYDPRPQLESDDVCPCCGRGYDDWGDDD